MKDLLAYKSLKKNTGEAFRRATLPLVAGLLIAAFGFGTANAQLNAYVASTGNSTVLVLDTATNTTTATVSGTGSRHLSLSPDGALLYSVTFNAVQVVDTATNAVIANIPTGNIVTNVVQSPNGFLYTCNNSSGTVSIIDTATYTVASTLPSLPCQTIAITPDGSSVWVSSNDVANSFLPTIVVIDTATNAITTSFAIGAVLANAPSRIAFTPDGSFAYAAGFPSNSVSVIDTATHATVATVPVGSLPTFVDVTPDGAFAYVANLTANSVSVIDTATNTVVATIPVGAFPRALAFTPDGASAYVTNSNSDSISMIDTATQTVTSTFAAGSRPWGIIIGRAPNVAPALASDQASVAVNETQTATNSGTVSDGNGDSVTLSASVGAVVNNGDGTWSWSFTTGDGPTDSQTVTITGDDGQGGTSTTSFSLSVDNVAPTITSVSNNGPILVGGSANITVAASDVAGAADPLAYSFDCDNNGSFEVGPQAGNSASCTFASAGSFPVNVQVSDGDGGTATGSTVVTVVADADHDGIPDGTDNCPAIANPTQANFDNDAFGDACDADIDNDGRANNHDLCPFTPPGTVVGRLTGCSIAQLCPCDGPFGTNRDWRNHGQYVACVTVTAVAFRLENLITTQQKVQIINAAAHSSCGR